MLDQRMTECLKQIAKAVAAQFGNNCEVVLHDLNAGAIDHTVVAIENGHVTGRRVGDGPSQVVLEALHDEKGVSGDKLGYLTRTPEGKTLKSSTVILKDERGTPSAIFGINLDITPFLLAENAIKPLVRAETEDGAEPTRIPKNVADMLDNLIDQSVKLIGKPVALMTKEEKIRAIHFLNDHGAFLITKSGDKVTKFFGISKYTLYSYIDAGCDGGQG